MTAREGGFSLVEILASVLLLAIALVPIMQLVPSLLQANESRRDLARLAAAGSSKLEELGELGRRGRLSVGTGSESCAGPPNCLLSWSVREEWRSSVPRAGSLYTIEVAACADANGNRTCDPAELQVRYVTRVTQRPQHLRSR